MKARILGISASPQKGGKVETLVQEILSASRLPHELVRLHELNIKPCKACNGCRRENLCIIEDDWSELRNKIVDASALVIGGWAFSGIHPGFQRSLWAQRHGGAFDLPIAGSDCEH